MNEPPRGDDIAAATATRETREVQAKAEEAGDRLARLRQDVVEVEARVSVGADARLVEANAQLVVATLRAQTDAEETARALEEASRAAELDALTGLPNRVLLLDRLAHAIARARRRNERLALLFLDLNNFKQINDTLGHLVGDQMLKRAAHCLASSVREADTVSRFGGDEFVILLEVVHPSDAMLIAEKVIAALGVPSRVGDHELRLTASIGISIFPDDGKDADTLIDLADAAMYRAKRHELGGVVFHGEEPARDRSRRARLDSPSLTLSSHEPSLAEHEQRYAQLREANEQLVLAAFGARDLEAAAATTQRRQSDFLTGLAHELRNGVAPIRTAAALMTGVHPRDPLLPRLQTVIERQVAHLSRLVVELLDMSRVNAGKPRLAFGKVEMATIIHDAVAISRPAMDAHLQRLGVDVPSCPLEVRGDPVQLAQILDNLLDNASKYTPDGGDITLSAGVVHGAVVITVSDSGMGITAPVLHRVFEPFVQDQQAIAFNRAGLGIGLTVVRELVEAHDGSVVASSAGSGLGSKFIVTLPLADRTPSDSGVTGVRN